MTKKTGKKPASKAIYVQPFMAHFSDCDPEGILFFAQYFKWAHDAIEGFVQAKGLWSSWFQNSAAGAPLRHVEADYMAPLHHGKTADCMVHVAAKGVSSITFECHFVCEKKVTAVVRTVHVFVDRKKMKSTKIPKNIQAAL